jgi:type I restriction enzyme S subunit
MKWESRTLGDLGEWGSGGTPLSSTPAYYNGTIPWLIIEDLNDGVVTSSQKTITELGLKNSSAKIVEPGTLLIAMYGSISSSRKGLNMVYLALTKETKPPCPSAPLKITEF